jgi:hypothetical protein
MGMQERLAHTLRITKSELFIALIGWGKAKRLIKSI